MFELSDKDFEYIRKRIYDYARINLTEKKRSLVIARLSKKIRRMGLNSFEEYIHLIKENENEGKEFQDMVDALSTNYSTFFREGHHFQFLEEVIYPGSKDNLKIWSAASSSGQEIFSILISLKEFERNHHQKINHKFYASDVSSDILRKACQGVYNHQEVKNIEPHVRERYFLKGVKKYSDLVKVKSEFKKDIVFFKLNLMDDEYRLPKMDVIFLRNVIIYFDRPTKVEVMTKMYRQLKPGGYLILGHSESMAGLSSDFELVGKTIYRRRD
ncbi:CheR family methyltransferase [Spirochaeta cellobiosiphila]|uniref:CheR family methyltransferase n=1 Tax=Spirochaeta cellobiosiphila TaxID=504483 RepID=UPI00042A0B9E|nr:CheR family methyltransferase [Spirochaeta cellobiosiphila]